jgi:flavin-dependent dehydrogenase
LVDALQAALDREGALKLGFDQFLIDRASEAGTKILDGEKVTNVEERADAVKVGLAKGMELRCQVLVGADGSESMVAKSLSLRPQNNDGYGVAVESETPFNSSVPFPKEEFQFVHLDFGRVPNGYGWVFPKKEWLSIGIGGMFRETKKLNPRQYFKSFVKGLSYIPEGTAGKRWWSLKGGCYETFSRCLLSSCLGGRRLDGHCHVQLC